MKSIAKSIYKYDNIPRIRDFSFALVNNQKNKELKDKVLAWLESNGDRLVEICSEETKSPIYHHAEDLKLVKAWLKRYSFCSDRLPKGNIYIKLSANEPIILSTLTIMSAILSGNNVLVRPSSKSPSYSFYLVKEINKIQKGRAIWHCSDHNTVKEIAGVSAIDLVISFGGYSTNKKIGPYYTSRGIEFIPENEGNHWVYIDKDIPFSIKNLSEYIVRGFTRHNGQMCDSVRAVFINSKIYDSLILEIRERFEKLKYGENLNIRSDISGLLPGSEHLVKEFLNKNNESRIDFHPKSRNTGICEITDYVGSPWVAEPIFIPFLYVIKIGNYKVAKKAFENDNKYKLIYSFFSNNEEVITEMSDIFCGRININKDPIDIAGDSPWGGFGMSGNSGPISWKDRFTNNRIIDYGK